MIKARNGLKRKSDPMTQWDVLRQLCPRLYKHEIAFECAIGWYDILRYLSIEIEKILEKDTETSQVPEGEENEYNEMYAVQVKEKYGTLRFYMSCETDEIWQLIRETEKISSHTCEACGEPGIMRGTKWFSVRCDKCYEEKK
jgi:hypothetical protein